MVKEDVQVAHAVTARALDEAYQNAFLVKEKAANEKKSRIE